MAKITKTTLLTRLHKDFCDLMWAKQQWAARVPASSDLVAQSNKIQGINQCDAQMAYINGLVVSLGLRNEAYEMKIEKDEVGTLRLFEKPEWAPVAPEEPEAGDSQTGAQ